MFVCPIITHESLDRFASNLKTKLLRFDVYWIQADRQTSKIYYRLCINMLILFQNESDASTSSSPTVKGYESIIKVSYFKSIYLIFCLREEGGWDRFRGSNYENKKQD